MTMHKKLVGDIKEDHALGEQIAGLLFLKKKNDRYQTAWGDKTAAGLARCVRRILEGDIQP